MRKDHFRDLKTLIGSMKAEEIDVAKRFIVSFDSNVTLKNNKSLRLFKLLLQKPTIVRDLAKDAVSKDINDTSFDRMIKRLREKLLESLLLTINTRRKESYGPLDQARFRIQRQISQADILFRRGLKDDATRMLNKAVVEARRSELWEELVDGLHLRSRMLAASMDAKEFTKHHTDLVQARECRDLVNHANDVYYRFFLSDTNPVAEMEDELKATLVQLGEAAERFESAVLGYYLHSIRTKFEVARGNYHEAVDAGRSLVALLDEYPARFGEQDIGSSLLDLSICLLMESDPASALTHARRAKDSFEPGNWDYENAVEVEIKSLVLQNQLPEAMEVVNDLLVMYSAVPGSEDYKLRYLKSCILFMMGDHQACDRELDDIASSGFYYASWTFGMNLLHLMNTAQLTGPAAGIAGLGPIREQVRQLRDSVWLYPKRETAIIEVFQHLQRHKLNYQAVSEHASELIKKLQGDPAFRWKASTDEVIIFDQWLQARIQDKPFRLELIPATSVA